MKLRNALATSLALAIATAALALAPTAATAIAPRASLTDIENDVMCTACHEPLNVSQSPEAYSERAFIRTLIAQGETKPQILKALVAQYGPAVLGKPPAHGFNLTVYILPPAILVAGVAVLVITLPKWRRRARERAADQAVSAPALTSADADRLNQELAHYKG
jgi:cytochrome c-type biogenesis protein CcmH